MQPARGPGFHSRLAFYILIGVAFAVILVITATKVIFRAPEHDEAELLHAAWLMAHGGRIWIDFFENHAALYVAVNSWIFNTDSVLFALYAKYVHLIVYYLTAYLFGHACCLWLGIADRQRVPFLLLSLLVFVILTWPCDVGMVRPENFSVAALMIGIVSGYYIRAGRAPVDYALSFLSAVCLALAVSLSLRSLFLVIAAAVLIVASLRTHRALVGLLSTACIGVAGVILLDLHVAPLSLYFFWLVDFNGHLRPFHQTLPPAAYSSLAVGLLSIGASCAGLIAGGIAKSRPHVAPALGRIVNRVGKLHVRRLFLAQAVVLIYWAYAFGDNSWGRQSFSGVAVATSFCASVMLALALEFMRPAPSGSPNQGGTGLSSLRTALPSVKARAQAPAAFVVVCLAGIALAGGVIGLAYIAVDKVVAMIARLQPAGMWDDVSLALSEGDYKLQRANDLLPLSESRNLGEWILWSKRECQLFRNERVLLTPPRHPICARDASFYWYGGIHISAMAREHLPFKPRPPFEVAQEIVRVRPVLMDIYFLGDVWPAPKVEALLARDYVLLQSDRLANWAWLRKDFLTR